jgi:hypothetical protein
MKKRFLALPIFILFGWLAFSSFLGNPNTTGFYAFVEQFDMSQVWSEPKVITVNNTFAPRPQGFGTLGNNNNQLIYVHIINAFRSSDDRYHYMVTGKIKTQTEITDFTGDLNIKDAQLYEESKLPQYKEGFVKGEFDFNLPDSKQFKGTMSGQFQSFFIWGSDMKMHYDALDLSSTDFANGIFRGSWISSNGKITEPVNWRDVVIPANSGLSNNNWWE